MLAVIYPRPLASSEDSVLFIASLHDAVAAKNLNVKEAVYLICLLVSHNQVQSCQVIATLVPLIHSVAYNQPIVTLCQISLPV